MPDESTPAGTPAPAATVPPAVTPPAATPPAAPPSDADPEWVNKRIAQAKRSAESETLKALGVDSIDAGKAAIAASRALADEKKTELEKRDEKIRALEPTAAQAAKLLAVTTEHAARMMVGLTAEQQAAVKDLAGEDPAEQLRMITKLAPTWAKDAAAASAAGTPAAGAAAARPATTAPPATAPNGVTPPPADSRGTYEAIRRDNPFAAAAFGNANPAVYNPK